MSKESPLVLALEVEAALVEWAVKPEMPARCFLNPVRDGSFGYWSMWRHRREK